VRHDHTVDGRIVDQSAIEDKFNDWASKKLFLIADEVVARTELFHVKNKLKSLVTGEWIRINPKNVAAHDERNHVNIVFLSNESVPLVLEHDDRRYMVIHTPEKLPPEFYNSIRDEINGGGIEALHHYLLGVNLEGYDIHSKPLATKAKQQLIEANHNSVEIFMLDWFKNNLRKELPFCPCLCSQLYQMYKMHCDDISERFPRKRNLFIRDILMDQGWTIGDAATWESPYSTKNKTRKMVIPPDKLLAAHVDRDEIRGKWLKNEADTRGQWLSKSYEAFAEASGCKE